MDVLKGFKYAFIGLLHILRSEKNARIHLVTAIIVLIIGILLGVSNVGLAAIFFSIILVFLAEILNTAIEKTLDLVHPGPSDKVAVIKDMSAAAVLVTAVGAIAIGFVVLLPYLYRLVWTK